MTYEDSATVGSNVYRDFVRTFHLLQDKLQRIPTCSEVMAGMEYWTSRAYAYNLRDRAIEEGKIPAGVWSVRTKVSSPANWIRELRQDLKELLSICHNLTEHEPLGLQLRQMIEQHKEEVEQIITLIREKK